MLVLTRRKGESILIGDDIKIKILKAGNQVAVGIECPDDVHVVREELVKNIDCERTDCNWVDARNKAVISGEVCLTCNRIRAGNIGNR